MDVSKRMFLSAMRKHLTKYRRAYARKKIYAHLKSVKRKGREHHTLFPTLSDKREIYQVNQRGFKKPIKLLAPINFSFETDKVKVVKFLTTVRGTFGKHYDKVYVDLSQVEQIDLCTIVMLLSVMDYLSQRGVFVQGNFPSNEDALNLIKDTGFLSFVRVINERTKTTTPEPHGIIANLGRSTYNAEEASKINSRALKHIGNEQLGKSLYGLVGEMGGNTIQYAYSDERHYIYGYMPSQKDDFVTFIFADAGYGILNTLRKSLGNYFEELLRRQSKVQILRGAFLQKYRSKSGDSNRGLGLPYIKQLSDQKIIRDLKVLTNSVWLDFENHSESKQLSHNYNGTVYTWKIYKKS